MDISSESTTRDFSVDSLQMGGGGAFSSSIPTSVDPIRGADGTLLTVETDLATSSPPCLPIKRPSLHGDEELSLMQRWSIISLLISGRSQFENRMMLANCLSSKASERRERAHRASGGEVGRGHSHEMKRV